MRPRGLKVGELAKQTGLSVRTLHHYDEIGLLIPSQRTEAGHRLYAAGDVARLQQVLSLRQLGLSLDEVRACLDRADCAPLDVVELHLQRIDAQVALLQRLHGKLRFLAAALRARDEVGFDTFLEAIEGMTMNDELINKYYTPEQLKWLEQRRQTVGEERIRQVEAEWPVLIAKVRTAMQQGADPASPEVQTLMAQWQGLVNEFTGGNPEIAGSLRKMYQENPNAGQPFGGPDPALFEYVNRAMAARG